MDFELRKEYIGKPFYVLENRNENAFAHVFILTCDQYSEVLISELIKFYNELHNLTGSSVYIYAPKLTYGTAKDTIKNLQQGFYIDEYSGKKKYIHKQTVKTFIEDYLYISSKIAEQLLCVDKLPCIAITNTLNNINETTILQLKSINHEEMLQEIFDIIKIIKYSSDSYYASKEYVEMKNYKTKLKKEIEELNEEFETFLKKDYFNKKAQLALLSKQIEKLKVEQKKRQFLIEQKVSLKGKNSNEKVKNSIVAISNKIIGKKLEKEKLEKELNKLDSEFHESKVLKYKEKLKKIKNKYNEKASMQKIKNKYILNTFKKNALKSISIIYKEMKDLFELLFK